MGSQQPRWQRTFQFTSELAHLGQTFLYSAQPAQLHRTVLQLGSGGRKNRFRMVSIQLPSGPPTCYFHAPQPPPIFNTCTCTPSTQFSSFFLNYSLRPWISSTLSHKWENGSRRDVILAPVITETGGVSKRRQELDAGKGICHSPSAC